MHEASDRKHPAKKRPQRSGPCLAVGMALGAGIGAAFGNVAIGMAIGLSIGHALDADTG